MFGSLDGARRPASRSIGINKSNKHELAAHRLEDVRAVPEQAEAQLQPVPPEVDAGAVSEHREGQVEQRGRPTPAFCNKAKLTRQVERNSFSHERKNRHAGEVQGQEAGVLALSKWC